jgi:type IV secretory pathway component VirB8
MNGVLPSAVCAPSLASNRIEAHATAIANTTTLIAVLLISIFLPLQRIVNVFLRIDEARQEVIVMLSELASSIG